MNFADFAQRLGKAAKGKENTYTFARVLFENITPDDETKLLDKINDSCFKAYYNGNSEITQIAKKIQLDITPEAFKQFIYTYSTFIVQNICNNFSDVIEDINFDNAGERLAALFSQIIVEAAAKTRQRPQNAKDIEASQIDTIQPIPEIARGTTQSNPSELSQESEKRKPLPVALEPKLEAYILDKFAYYKDKNIAVKTPQLLYMLLQYKDCDILDIFNGLQFGEKRGYGDFLIHYFKEWDKAYQENSIAYEDKNYEDYLKLIKHGIRELKCELDTLDNDDYKDSLTSWGLDEYVPAHILCYFILTQHDSQTLEEMKKQVGHFFDKLVNYIKINRIPTLIVSHNEVW